MGTSKPNKSTSGHDITEEFVANLSEEGYYRDARLAGFCVKVRKRMINGETAFRKVFLVSTKVKGTRKNATITIGEFGKAKDQFSVKQAREKAESIRVELKKGIQPNKEVKEKRAQEEEKQQFEKSRKKLAEITLADLLDDYLRAKAHKHKPDTQKFYRYTVSGAIPDWVELPIVEITENMVKERYLHIINKEKQIPKAESFRRVLRALTIFASKAYKDSKGGSLLSSIPVNCLADLGIVAEVKPRERVLEPDELASWFKAVLALRSESPRDYLLLMVLTGLRKDEAASLAWEDVDWKKKQFTVRDTKNRTDHILPMTTGTYSILSRRNKTKESLFVFPGFGSECGYIQDVRAHQLKVIQQSKVDFDLHDLRRTFATIAGAIAPEQVVKRLLNHRTKADVTQRHYLKFSQMQLVDWLQKIEQQILKLGKASLPADKSGKVVRLHKRAQ